MGSSIPQLVRAYAERAVGSEFQAESVCLTQVGEMVLKPGAAPRPFTATEEFSVDRVAFAWRARFRVLGPIVVSVIDGYNGTDGRLDVRLLGLPIQRQGGPQLARGEAYRYLAEIAWVPQAMLANPQLEWRMVDGRTVEVSTVAQGEQITVRLVFNDAGEISQTVADRPRIEAGNEIARWVGEYADYEWLGGMLVPTRAAVRWELADGPFTYWRGTIKSLEVRARAS